MATRYIDVVIRARDEASSNVKKIESEVNSFTSKQHTAHVGADTSGAESQINGIGSKLRQITDSKWTSKLEVLDNATSKINQIHHGLKSLVTAPFKATIKVLDYATSPIRKIKNALLNIKTIAAGIVVGMGLKKAAAGFNKAIATADAYTGAQIGFQTLLGEDRAQQMMNDIDAFAKKTPFNTTGVISNVQKMMAYGWNPEDILKDMEIIGDAAAATGKGDQGLERIVYALAEIKSKGKLSTQELNQLSGQGIKAKAYLAQGMGYGTSDEGMMKLAKDLEKGNIGANQAIEMILEGMKEFQGMMDSTANSTVKGLKSQLEDVFEINILRRWGQGLQEGTRKGLGSLVELLDASEDKLEKVGDFLEEMGKTISGFAANKIQNAVDKLLELTESDAWKYATGGEKLKLVWDTLVADPISEWWNNGGKEDVVNAATEMATTIGKTVLDVLSAFAKEHPLITALAGIYVGTGAIGSIGAAATGLGALGLGGGAAAAAGGGTVAAGGAATAAAGSAGLAGLAGVGTSVAGIAGGGFGAYTAATAVDDIIEGVKEKDASKGQVPFFNGVMKLGGVGTGAMAGFAIGGPVGALIGAGVGGGLGWLGAREWTRQNTPELPAETTASVADRYANMGGEKNAFYQARAQAVPAIGNQANNVTIGPITYNVSGMHADEVAEEIQRQFPALQNRITGGIFEMMNASYQNMPSTTQ